MAAFKSHAVAGEKMAVEIAAGIVAACSGDSRRGSQARGVRRLHQKPTSETEADSRGLAEGRSS